MRIVADSRIPFLKGVFEPYADVVFLPGGEIDAKAVKEADALIVRTRTRCGRALLAGSRVKHIATATIGFDHINVPEVESLGISWSSAPGCNANSVGQYVSCALQALGEDLRGKTLGVVGVGHVGGIVARYGALLGMKVLLNDPPRQAAGEEGFSELEELLGSADVVTLHVPLEYGGAFPTFHMAGKAFFERMKPGAFFFNASRGEAAESEALKSALRSGRLEAAVLDVWENEPAIDKELMGQSFISTMHIAGYSTDGKANGTAASVRAVARALNIAELTEWSPGTLPPPLEERVIPFTSVGAALLHTYDPRRDSEALRRDPGAFEELRGTYPRRREFQAFTVTGAPAAETRILRGFGFNIGS